MTQQTTTVRETTRLMRGLTAFVSLLALIAGPLLYFLPERTDTLFAWTINPPLTALFLGGGFLTSLVILLMAARQRIWARARIAYPAIIAFTLMMLIATLIHSDRFHFNADARSARIAAWGWLVVYILAPIIITAVYLYQLRQPGGDPPRRAALPTWFRVLLGVQAALMLIMGLSLFFIPQTVLGLWPWMLTPLTARASGSGLTSLGVVAALAVRENAWERISMALAANIIGGALELIAVLRYPDTMQWGTINGVAYVVFFVAIIILGIYGAAARRA